MRQLFLVIVAMSIGLCWSNASIGSMAVLAPKEATHGTIHMTDTKTKVINAFLDRIENGFVYTKDGRKFSIPAGAKIIDNSKPNSKLKSVELIFKGNWLISITIR